MTAIHHNTIQTIITSGVVWQEPVSNFLALRIWMLDCYFNPGSRSNSLYWFYSNKDGIAYTTGEFSLTVSLREVPIHFDHRNQDIILELPGKPVKFVGRAAILKLINLLGDICGLPNHTKITSSVSSVVLENGIALSTGEKIVTEGHNRLISLLPSTTLTVGVGVIMGDTTKSVPAWVDRVDGYYCRPTAEISL